MRSAVSLSIILLCAALAGCVGGDDAPDVTTANSGGAGDAGGAASGGANGANTGNNAADTDAEVGNGTAGAVREPDIITFDGEFTFRLRPPTGPIVGIDDDDAKMELSMDGTDNGYILILEWDAANQLNEQLGLWMRKAPSDGTDHNAAGTSPVRMPVLVNETSGGVYALDVVPVGGQAAVAAQQSFTLTIINFLGTPFDPDYQLPDA